MDSLSMQPNQHMEIIFAQNHAGVRGAAVPYENPPTRLPLKRPVKDDQARHLK
jgi:hypothetical protein